MDGWVERREGLRGGRRELAIEQDSGILQRRVLLS